MPTWKDFRGRATCIWKWILHTYIDKRDAILCVHIYIYIYIYTIIDTHICLNLHILAVTVTAIVPVSWPRLDSVTKLRLK